MIRNDRTRQGTIQEIMDEERELQQAPKQELLVVEPLPEPSWSDHIGELRRRCVIIGIALVCGFLLTVFWEKEIVRSILAFAYPDHEIFTRSIVAPLQQGLRLSLIVSLLLVMPIALYQLWRFVSPGMTVRERRPVLIGFSLAAALFCGGCCLGIWAIFPWFRDFFMRFNREIGLLAQYDFEYALSLFLTTVVISGLLCEFPILIWILGRLQVVTAARMRRYRRPSYLGMVILAALIAPGDVFSWVLVSVPLVLAYEAGVLWLSWSATQPKEEIEDIR